MPTIDLIRRSLPWMKRIVLLIVLVGLTSAAVKAIQRWQFETAKMSEQVDALLARADEAPSADRLPLLLEANSRADAIPSLKNVRWDFVAGSAALYAIGLIPPAFVLHQCLAAMAIRCTFGRAVAAQLIGHAGKYIPGKAMVVVLRVAAVLPRDATPKYSMTTDVRSEAETLDQSLPPRRVGAASSCVFFETLMMMGIGGAVAGMLLWNSPLPPHLRLAAAAMAIASVVPVLPPVIRRVLSLVERRREKKRILSNNTENNTANDVDVNDDQSGVPGKIDETAFTWRLFGECVFASLLSWGFIGVSFAMLVAAIPSFESTPDWIDLAPMATAAISLGMVLGFASLLPGGAGVREYVTLLVLSPVVGATHALLAVLAARLMFIAVEGVAAGLAYFYLRSFETKNLLPIFTDDPRFVEPD